MFGTVIMDAYRKEEVEEVLKAIEDLCSPNDNYGWASAGIYCFWDYYAEIPLYIGLASDLAERFRQHNGLVKVKDGSSKYDKIQEYFSRNEKLGYSIFVQSPLSQPLVHRNRNLYEQFAKENDSLVENMISEDAINDIKRVEGILIEAFKQKYGHYPIWNLIGGSIEGQMSVTPNVIDIVKSFYESEYCVRNPILAHSTIRELSCNPKYACYENYLHAVRMGVLILGMDYESSLEYFKKNSSIDIHNEISKNNYLKKKLSL